MTEKLRFDNTEMNKISEEFVQTRKEVNDLAVEVDKINDIDPLIIIRAVSSGKTPDVTELCSIAELLFDGSTISFISGKDTVKSLIYARNNGHNKLTLAIPESYFLDRLLDVTYAILLKKSTPQ
jgi:hypothetical protein